MIASLTNPIDNKSWHYASDGTRKNVTRKGKKVRDNGLTKLSWFCICILSHTFLHNFMFPCGRTSLFCVREKRGKQNNSRKKPNGRCEVIKLKCKMGCQELLFFTPEKSTSLLHPQYYICASQRIPCLGQRFDRFPSLNKSSLNGQLARIHSLFSVFP